MACLVSRGIEQPRKETDTGIAGQVALHGDVRARILIFRTEQFGAPLCLDLLCFVSSGQLEGFVNTV